MRLPGQYGFGEAWRVIMSTAANPEDRARTCSEGFLEGGTTRPGSRRARFRRVKKWGMGTQSRETRAGASKAQVKCPCLTAALARGPPGL